MFRALIVIVILMLFINYGCQSMNKVFSMSDINPAHVSLWEPGINERYVIQNGEVVDRCGTVISEQECNTYLNMPFELAVPLPFDQSTIISYQ